MGCLYPVYPPPGADQKDLRIRHFEHSEKSNMFRRAYGLGLDFSLRSK
jgi:hypothetical protein